MAEAGGKYKTNDAAELREHALEMNEVKAPQSPRGGRLCGERNTTKSRRSPSVNKNCMKTKIIFLGVLFLLSLEIAAQDFKKFRVGFGISYLADHPGVDAGLSWEAGYRIKDNALIGFKAESAFASGNTINSKTVFFQHYFPSSNRFRPFAGVGAGIYRPTNSMIGGCSPGPFQTHTTNEETKFGFYPRAGFDYRHFTMTLEWNIAGTSSAIVSNDAPPTDIEYIAPHTEYMRNNYLSLKMGFFLGGGRKKK